MKKIQNKAILCAMALVAATGFVSCSSDEVVEKAPVNPTYDGKTVKTQFAINIGSLKGNTRMSADDTQQAKGKFNGMYDIYLFPVTVNATPDDGPAANTTLESNINLANILSDGLAQSHRKIYENVAIPTGTTDFLLYALGPVGTDAASNFQQGAIDVTPALSACTAPNQIKFNSVKVATGDFATELNARVTFLNSILTAATNWEAETDDDLKKAYQGYTETDKVRAVASAPLTEWMQELYTLAKDKAGNTNADAIAAAIVSTKQGYFTADGSGNLTIVSGKEEFPSKQNLPDGVAIVKYNGTSKTYETTTIIGNTDKAILNVENLTYPLPITYRCNTLAKATDEDIDDNTGWPATSEDWAIKDWAAANWYKDVRETSRTIALDNPINYGVALLETTVTCTNPTLKDHNSTPTHITVPATGFPVTAILVGGQPKSVNWNYLSNEETDNHTQTVYDKKVEGIKAIYNAVSPSNYTLVFDSHVTDVNQAKICVAIELENNSGSKFTAQDGIVGINQKFYLIAELDPQKYTTGTQIDWTKVADDLRFPEKGTDRVFIQDFRTKANLKIASLENSYVAIPDLRSTTLKLGLSVDLEWQTGMTFDVDID